MAFDYHSLNRVTLIATIAHNEQMNLQQTKSGTSYLKLRVYTQEKDGKDKKFVNHRITVWDKKAEYVTQYLQPGAKIAIEGKLQTDIYVMEGDKRVYLENGNNKTDRTKHYATQIVASNVTLIESGQQSKQKSASYGGYGNSLNGRYKAPAHQSMYPPPSDDDVPF